MKKQAHIPVLQQNLYAKKEARGDLMGLNHDQSKGVIFIKTTLQVIIFVFIIMFMSNLNALVDAILHPEIPYFDKEHLIVGGMTGLVSSMLWGLFVLYARHLEKALSRIETLESYLSICANCKKIKITDSNPDKKETWQPIESYIKEKTATEFSHSICPECTTKLYSEYIRDRK
jgi:hypothetical protein